MITKEQLKAKIDGVDEQYLDILDKIIQTREFSRVNGLIWEDWQ